MIRITKNEDELQIKNVICFYIGECIPEKYKEISKKKKDGWSYQDYLTEACHKLKFNLVWLNKKYVEFYINDDKINIDDNFTDVHISLNKSNKNDTVIFQGQANDNPRKNYEGLMRAFEYFHFYMLNTFDEIRMASDKFLSSNLLKKHNIPQPNFILVTKEIMLDDEGITKNTFKKLLDSIYTDNESIGSGNRNYVVKILGGSCGIGVFICNESELEPILQTVFKISPKEELIIQEFKQNKGDIRVHAFSVDGMVYEIIAAMKRNKIKGDFRSNVSLGATTDEVELTEKQREIVLETAKLSGCRWVGVDLMDCEDGRSVVIEYNSSPGVQGISQQINKNMFEIVLNKINEYFVKNKTPEDSYHEYKDTVTAFVKYDEDAVAKCSKNWGQLSDKRNKVMEKCLDFVPGTQYRLHGKNNELEGLDCSGYVARIFKYSLGIELPMMCAGYFIYKESNEWEMIDKEYLKPGDIGILNDTTKNNHMGIYAGDGKWFENSIVYGVQLTNYNKFKYFFRIKNIDAE